ncbi:hypothetical protein ACMFLR_22335 [Delftia tsuruhatensis]|uniref:hypothetical protein n=1 Tax=Delftia tsuruhatensis TaxID=180282 RepID=UPI0004D6002E|nr:hypothetical protein [Delftia tsuruhatensis]KEH06870.1 hypothetical protein GY14_31880 [Delftia tsuruhatensis]MDH0423617.1 hypothetical protein [Delftia tsuruhatensis]
MHQSLSLRSQLALAMISAAGGTIAATPKRADDIVNGIKRALDVLAPEHEVQGQPSDVGDLSYRIDMANFAESVATGQFARGGVTGGLGPTPTFLVGPGGSIAGVAASIPTHKDAPKSDLEIATERYERACELQAEHEAKEAKARAEALKAADKVGDAILQVSDSRDAVFAAKRVLDYVAAGGKLDAGNGVFAVDAAGIHITGKVVKGDGSGGQK